MQSFINALLQVQAQRAKFFDKIFMRDTAGENVPILSHDICKLIRDHDPAHTIHYL
jgi:hypothetical protein